MENEIFIFPASFAQQRLWFLDQLLPGNPAYNMPAAFRVRGALDFAVLQQSFAEIICRHESLRTAFTLKNDRPMQIVYPPKPFKLSRVDLAGVPQHRREAEVEKLVAEEATRAFDLAKGPLFRATVLELSKDEFVLLYTMHHIVSDGWSLSVLARELSVLYEAFYQRKKAPLSQLPIQYVDFAIWQREWLKGERLESQLSYWKTQLDGITPLELPTDRPRPAVPTFQARMLGGTLQREIADRLIALSRQNGSTLFMTLLAAFQTLLQRYTGQTDIAVGSPIANRNRAEIEGLIGVFVNSLVMRTDVSGDPSFRELLVRVRETALGAYAHQDLPFERLVEELQPERDLARNPIFQVMFALQNAPNPELQLCNLSVKRFGAVVQTTRFDLEVHCWESYEGLHTWFVYNTDLFDTATIERMRHHFGVLLERIAANPDRRISDLPISSDAEARQLLVEWNDTERDSVTGKCIHELFEEQAEKTPDAIAVVIEQKQLSYGVLNARANQVAHHLRRRGVGPEVLVGICAERSFELVIGLLGILKAGGAYVPFDPSYPQMRLEFMLRDSQVSSVLTQEKFVSKVGHRDVICLDRDWEQIAEETKENSASGVTGKNLAYVIYTSGSTGKPKGVAVEHGSLSNLMTWHQAVYGITAADRATQLASPAFDACGWELWPYLTAGGCIHVPTDETIQAPAKLLDWFVNEHITISFLPTPLTEAFLDEPMPAGLALRTLLTGGDKLRRLPQKAWPFQLANNYGPTENTVVSTWCTVSPSRTDGILPPIGKPIHNTKVYVLDPHLNPVPVGVSGELYIGGAGLARSYLNRPDLTAEKFVPNRFSEEPGARLYRTGDLVRYRADGNIEFLGRIDHQVKVRGFRIELGEIEIALSQHKKVRDAVVTVREDMPGEKRLVAYVVAAEDRLPTMAELKMFLRESLPNHMIPSTFVFLDSFPLTPNGKIDRRTLPIPPSRWAAEEATYVAPRTEEETVIADIWQDLLHVEKVGIYDNFFDAGGHSLLLTSVRSRLSTALGRDVSIVELFRHPTISSLREYLRNGVDQSSIQTRADRAAKQLMAMSEIQQHAQTISRRRSPS